MHSQQRRDSCTRTCCLKVGRRPVALDLRASSDERDLRAGHKRACVRSVAGEECVERMREVWDAGLGFCGAAASAQRSWC